MNIQNVAVSEIKTNSKWIRMGGLVDGLVESMEKIGLINPIIITKDFELLAGGRRLTAARSLGWKTILAKVVSTGDIENELISIDENLEREDFEGIEYEEALARRKELYEILHPETKHGGYRGNQYTGGKLQNLPLGNFVKDTSEKTGKSERTIRQAIKRANENSDKVKQARKEGFIGAAHADALTKLTKKEQDYLLKYVEKIPAKIIDNVIEKVKETSVEEFINEQKESNGVIDEAKRSIFSIKKNGNALANTLSFLVKNRTVFYGKELLEINIVMAKVLDYGNQFMNIQKERK